MIEASKLSLSKEVQRLERNKITIIRDHKAIKEEMKSKLIEIE